MKNKQVINLILCIRDLPQQPTCRRRQSFCELVPDYPWDGDSLRKSLSTLDRKEVICSLAYLKGKLLVFTSSPEMGWIWRHGKYLPAPCPLPNLIQRKLHALSFLCREGRCVQTLGREVSNIRTSRKYSRETGYAI